MNANLPGRVLVVDDDEQFLRVCGRLLTRAGLQVEAVPRAEDALTRIGQQRYDVIVSDVSMPVAGGLDLLKAARSCDATVPFILISGAPTVATALSAVDLGASKYLQKPFDADQFVTTVTDAVARRVHENELPRLHERLDDALDQLWMAYQPIVGWAKRGPTAYEALMRTMADGIKGPGEMLELAEKTNRLSDLGWAVRTRVAKDLAQLPDGVDVFVNLHPADLDDARLYELDAPLCMHAKRVVFEITERASVTNDGALEERVAALRGLGYRIAVDDLGAGYSGLTTLARVQPEYVKLDGSLVRQIDSSRVNQRVISAMLALSGELGLKVIAEAVETPAEFATLRGLGVDLLQGYYFARPARPFVQVDASRWAT